MRIAVVGGTGVAGRQTIEALRRGGHTTVIIARSAGVDLITGDGLDKALAGVDAVIDVSNLLGSDAASTRNLFETATNNLLAAEQRANVRHHVLLSIVGVDRINGNAHFAGKRAQEQLLETSPIPATIMRATQFHELAGSVVDWVRKNDVAVIPPLLVQPVAAADVGEVLAEIAVQPPQGRAVDLGGPEPQDFIDMARRTLSARGESIRLIPSWRGGFFGLDAAGEVLLPGPDARIAPTTFEAWLKGQSAKKASHRR
jgi:uncharacterized protein YbjT (DUF2867 family)